MPLELPGSIPLFLVTSFGLAWPVVAPLKLAPAEKLAATAALSVLGIYLVAWAVYVFGLPPAADWIIPALAAGGLLLNRRPLAETLRDADVRDLLIGQLFVIAWCLGWLALVVSYSGGGWAGDWFEHFERARFFLGHESHDILFLGTYPLPARPPLANVVTAAFLQLTQGDFAIYQVISTLLSSLVFLPAALLARRFAGGRRVSALVVVAFMLNPLLVQNATFAWTKLPAAFFVLTALHFFLRTRDESAPRAAALLFALSLAAGLLTHYSGGPYAAVLGAAWFAWGWKQRHGETRWRMTAIAASGAFLVLATWFGWSIANYGVHDTFLSNPSVTSSDARHGSQLAKTALNLSDTLVPHFLRPLDETLIAQTSVWGWRRDWFFQLYQLNLFFVFGSVAWLALLVHLRRAARTASSGERGFWVGFILGVVLLGIAAHGQRDHWGLAHICLQALVLLGLAFLAARWPALGRGWKIAVGVGATLDFSFGILLHFLVQNRPALTPTVQYNQSALMNLGAKFQHHIRFLNDVLTPAPALVLALLAALLMLALARAHTAALRTDSTR